MEQNLAGKTKKGEHRRGGSSFFGRVCEKSYLRSQPQNEVLDTFAQNQSSAPLNPLAIKTLAFARVECVFYLLGELAGARGVYSSALALKRIMGLPRERKLNTRVGEKFIF
jgi:hypothetical protein